MRTADGLFNELCNVDALDLAIERTVRGKRRRPDVAWFLFRRDRELAGLARELCDDIYHPSPFELLIIRDPKRRVIARVPLRDRVVQTALVTQMEPIFLPSLMPEAFASRLGYGTARAVLRLLALVQRHRFVLHLDIRSYFPSVDIARLSDLLAARIRDERFLRVVGRVLEHGRGLYDDQQTRSVAGIASDWPPPSRGLPIGSYMSQFFAAHVYLSALDHRVKRALKVPGYLRYVDDLFLFGERRADLVAWRADVAAWLDRERGHRLKHPDAPVLPCGGHLDALGCRVRRSGITPLPRATKRLLTRVIQELRRPGSGRTDFARSLAGRAGVLFP